MDEHERHRGQVVPVNEPLIAQAPAGALPGLNNRDPLVIGAALLAQAGSHRDDPGVLVLTP